MKNFFDKIGRIGGDCKEIFFELFWHRRFSAFFIYGSLLLNGVAWAVLWQLTKLNQEIIILHYNSYLGIDVMLNSAEEIFPDLFLVVIVGAVILFLDIFLSAILLYLSGVLDGKKSGKKEKECESEKELDVNLLGSNLIVMGGFLVQVAIFIYSVAILFVN